MCAEKVSFIPGVSSLSLVLTRFNEKTNHTHTDKYNAKKQSITRVYHTAVLDMCIRATLYLSFCLF